MIRIIINNTCYEFDNNLIAETIDLPNVADRTYHTNEDDGLFLTPIECE